MSQDKINLLDFFSSPRTPVRPAPVAPAPTPVAPLQAATPAPVTPAAGKVFTAAEINAIREKSSKDSSVPAVKFTVEPISGVKVFTTEQINVMRVGSAEPSPEPVAQPSVDLSVITLEKLKSFDNPKDALEWAYDLVSESEIDFDGNALFENITLMTINQYVIDWSGALVIPESERKKVCSEIWANTDELYDYFIEMQNKALEYIKK